MESNTYATTVYVDAPADEVFRFLRQITNLDKWTLGSRMLERIDDDTYMGSASGYQGLLCYHVRTLLAPSDPQAPCAIEWQCGYTYRSYFKQYPVLVLPAALLGDDQSQGCYVHWVSVIDPSRRTPMIMEGIETVHRFESRALKALLERVRGHQYPVAASRGVETDTIYVDAPLQQGVAFLEDARNLSTWSPLFKASGDTGPSGGRFQDEYLRLVDVSFHSRHLEDGYVLLTQDFVYPEHAALQRTLFLCIPCQRAFGESARGMLLHRIAWWPHGEQRRLGRTQIADYGAENMACKRHIEARSGNHYAFAQGMSYRPDTHDAAAAPSGGDGLGRGAPPVVFSPQFARDPYPHYQRMREQFPLYFDPQAHAWILSRYDDIKLALTDDAFTTESYAAQTEPLLGKTLIQLEGRDHVRQRKLLANAFGASQVRMQFTGVITDCVDHLLAPLAARGQAELMQDFVTQFPVRIMARFLGLPEQDRDRFRGWYTALIRGALNLTGDAGVARSALAARDQLDGYLRSLLHERRREPGDDMLSRLIAERVDGESLNDEDIIRFGMLMVFAAGETTEKGLATVLRNLIAHPEQLDAVRADRSLVGTAIAESLRYTAPTHMVPRKTRQAVKVSAGEIPSGAEVMCFIASANRDEAVYGQADRFDIFRAQHAPLDSKAQHAIHLAFGAGQHFCLGAKLSQLELEIAVNRILDTMGGIAFRDGQAPQDEGLFLRCPSQIHVVFESR
jgi:cytochrome P450